MDTMLLIVTVVSLAIAAVSTAVAWQVTQADRRRRAARIAALSAAAGVAVPAATDAGAAPAVEISSPHGSSLALPGTANDTLPAEDGAAGSRFLAADTSGSGSSGRQRWLMGAAAATALVVASAVVVSMLGAQRPTGADAAATAPLELVALAHSRADGVLAVSGLVRNPPSGTRVDGLEAEVRVFDPAGILIATRTARVDYLELAPGQESPFAVALGEAATAARYRVSFRSAGAMRPHVDRRTNAPSSAERTAEAR